jgi:hypothetical protein
MFPVTAKVLKLGVLTFIVFPFNRDVRGREFATDNEMLQKTDEHLKVFHAYAKGM